LNGDLGIIRGELFCNLRRSIVILHSIQLFKCKFNFSLLK